MLTAYANEFLLHRTSSLLHRSGFVKQSLFEWPKRMYRHWVNICSVPNSTRYFYWIYLWKSTKENKGSDDNLLNFIDFAGFLTFNLIKVMNKNRQQTSKTKIILKWHCFSIVLSKIMSKIRVVWINFTSTIKIFYSTPKIEAGCHWIRLIKQAMFSLVILQFKIEKIKRPSYGSACANCIYSSNLVYLFAHCRLRSIF